MPDLNKIIDDLSSLTVVEAAELSKQLEEKWGVTAAWLQQHQQQQQERTREEKDDFTIMLSLQQVTKKLMLLKK